MTITNENGTAMSTAIRAIDPRTGDQTGPEFPPTADVDVHAIVDRAAAAFDVMGKRDRAWRAGLLDALAHAIEADADGIVATAMQETGFPETKLRGELVRTVFQFRFFADVVRDGAYLEAIIDPAGDTPMGPRPDLRRILTPLGPVAVFGASNFPLAFSVPGGDTASALASGCPVIVKAHSSHPATSARCAAVLRDAATTHGAPDGTIGIVFGTAAGASLVAHPVIRAVGFTGSLSGGKALLDIISMRDEPVPFYGELSSINPLVVTPAAAAERGESIGRALVGSITIGAGQLCTKPGIALIPRGPAGEALLTAARAAITEGDAPGPLLNERTHASFVDESARMRELDAVTVTRGSAPDSGYFVPTTLLEIDVDDADAAIAGEVFGPLCVAVRYDPADVETSVGRMLALLPNSLTATLHIGTGEDVRALVDIALPSAGRIVFNGFPTGVAVSWAQTHGGPWPSTNSIHTSVGATAIRRFLRPITYQDAPENVLPPELRNADGGVPRRVDGVLRGM